MKIQAYRCTWDGHPGWMQYHDHTDPLPGKWDDEPPDEVAALVLKIDADHEIDQLRAAISALADTELRELACIGSHAPVEDALGRLFALVTNVQGNKPPTMGY